MTTDLAGRRRADSMATRSAPLRKRRRPTSSRRDNILVDRVHEYFADAANVIYRAPIAIRVSEFRRRCQQELLSVVARRQEISFSSALGTTKNYWSISCKHSAIV